MFHIAARKIWLVFDDLTTVLHEPELGLLNTVNRDFENRPKRRPLAINRLISRPCRLTMLVFSSEMSNPSCWR